MISSININQIFEYGFYAFVFYFSVQFLIFLVKGIIEVCVAVFEFLAEIVQLAVQCIQSLTKIILAIITAVAPFAFRSSFDTLNKKTQQPTKLINYTKQKLHF